MVKNLNYLSFVLIAIISLLPEISEGQNKKNSEAHSRTVDSLRQILRSAVQDTNRVKTLNKLSLEISSTNLDTAIIIATQALSLSQKLKWKTGEAWAELRIGVFNIDRSNYKEALLHYNNALKVCEALISSRTAGDASTGKKIKGKTLGNIAIVYYEQADYPKALEYYFQGFKLKEEVGDKEGAGRTLCNIANVYNAQSDYPNALNYFYKGLKISEEVGDRRQVGAIYINIGSVYVKQSDYSKAMEFYLKALRIFEEVGDKQGLGRTFGNIANALCSQSEYSKAQEYYFKGLKIFEELGAKQVIGAMFGNIAGVYKWQGDSAKAKGNMTFAKSNKYPKALQYYLKSLRIAEEIGDRAGVANKLSNIGNLYTALGNYKEAEEPLNKALLISKEIGAQDMEKSIHEMLSGFYTNAKRPALALEHYKKFIALRDTIFSQENTKKSMRLEMDHDYEKKEAVAKAEHFKDLEKQQAVADEKSHKQNIIISSVAIGFLLVIVFAVFVFRSLRMTRKQKILIEIKNKETEQQKHLIEEKQKEIIDSITYAKRIQTALITSEKYINKVLIKLQDKE